MWYSIAKCFTYLQYDISTRGFHDVSTLRCIWHFFFCFLRCSRSGCMVNILSNQFRNVTFFWLKVARKMTKLKIALHGNLYFWIHESENAFCCIFFLWFIPLRQRAKVNIGPASRIDLAAFRSAVKCVRSAGLRCTLIRGKHVLLEEKKRISCCKYNKYGWICVLYMW